MHEAAFRLCPKRSLVTHLHGTELRMLDRIERLDAVAVALDTSLEGLAAAAGRVRRRTTADCLKGSASCCSRRI